VLSRQNFGSFNRIAEECFFFAKLMEVVSIKAIQFGVFIRFKYQQKFIDIDKIDANVHESCSIFSEAS